MLPFTWQRHRSKYLTKMEKKKVGLLVNWCFEPSQPLGVISRLKETFIKKYTVERTNKAEVRPKEQSRKRRVFGRIDGVKYS